MAKSKESFKIDELKELIELEKELKGLREERKSYELKVEVKVEKKEKLEKGKWYKHEDRTFFIKDIDKLSFFTYGLFHDWEDHWEVMTGSEIEKNLKPATDKEVEEMLIKEAKKRGFKEGVEFNTPDSTKCSPSHGLYGPIQWSGSKLEDDISACIFLDGKWATILEDKLELNGKEVTIEDDYIKIGCKTVDKNNLKDMLGYFKAYDITSINHQEIGQIKVSDLKNLIE